MNARFLYPYGFIEPYAQTSSSFDEYPRKVPTWHEHHGAMRAQGGEHLAADQSEESRERHCGPREPS